MKCVYVARAVPQWFIVPTQAAMATKIGVSANPERRKWGLRWTAGERVKIIWKSQPQLIKVAYGIEAALKRRFAHRRVKGEWFDLQPETIIKVARQLISKDRSLGKRNRPQFGKAITKRRTPK